MTYIGEVSWRSPSYDLVQFEDSGETTVTDTTVTVSPLFPGTNYLVRVSAVTQNGRGAEVTRYTTTRTSQDGKQRQCSSDDDNNVTAIIHSSGKLAYFQLRMSPVLSCLSFVV